MGREGDIANVQAEDHKARCTYRMTRCATFSGVGVGSRWASKRIPYGRAACR